MIFDVVKLLLGIALFVGVIVGLVAWLVWAVPYDSIEKHGKNYACSSIKEAFSFKTDEKCFQVK